jgi:hypothetical protein
MRHTSAACYLAYCSGWPEGNPQDPGQLRARLLMSVSLRKESHSLKIKQPNKQ